jgi:hypothetical protein
MVPEIVRLERAGVCGCGEPVAAGERAGFVAHGEQVVCLRCLAQMSTRTAEAAAPRRVAGVAAPLSPWMAEEAVIVATLQALRQDVPHAYPSDATLHVPAEWSALATMTPLSQAAPPTVVAPEPVVSPEPMVSAPEPEAVRGALPAPEAAVAPGPHRENEPTPATEAATEPAAASAVQAPARPVRRAGLFSRILTVRSLRLQGQLGPTGRPGVVVAAILDDARVKGVLALHHRLVPGHRSRVEHLAVGASGIHIIDVKHFKNASIEVRSEGAVSDLVVGGRVMTAAVEATARRVAAVRSLLTTVGLGDIPVSGSVCFVDGLFPLGVADLEVKGIRVLRPSGLTAMVATPGEFGPLDRLALRDFLAEQLPAAE